MGLLINLLDSLNEKQVLDVKTKIDKKRREIYTWFYT